MGLETKRKSAALRCAACGVVVLSLGACAEQGGGPARENTGAFGAAGAGADVMDPQVTTPAGGDPSTPPTTTVPDGDQGTSAQPTDGTTSLPCGVATVAANNCHTCHGPMPIGGAIKLVTHEDWHRMSPLYDPTKTVHEVARIRINSGEMPQTGVMSADDLAFMDAWLAAGAPARAVGESCPDTTTTTPGTTSPTQPTGGNGNECEAEAAYQALVAAPGETCYEFPVHAPGSAGAFSINPGESYHEWVYDVPWPPGTVGTRFGADFDNLPVLHHWLAFSQSTGDPDGTVRQNVTGTTLGTNANLIGGWAVGGCNVEFPPEMGLELPDSGKIMVQWHMWNSTGSAQQDGSVVQFCTVPGGSRPNTGGLTWLGTENFNGPLGMPQGMSDFSGTCINDSGAPITIVAFWPHMHEVGVNMRSEVFRGGAGTPELVFDEPFRFDYQVHYTQNPTVVLQPNDSIKSTCTFFNDTGANVAFGQSTKAEMCYQFAFSYPAGALDNGVVSLIGATNTCWQLGE